MSDVEVRGLTKRFAELVAVDSVSTRFAGGSRTALIGPNGAGKSTLFNLISGYQRPTSGTLLVGGDDVTRLGLRQRAAAGIVQTFQRSSLFDGLSVAENVALPRRRRRGFAARWWPTSAERAVDLDVVERLERVGLGGRAAVPAGALSHGERRQLELAVTLATEPRVLLLDEPTAGMSASETHHFVELVKSLDEALTVVIVEHDLDVVFELAERIVVLAAGRLLFEGAPAAARESAAVQDAYLGGADNDPGLRMVSG